MSLNPILIGYFSKHTMKRPDWLKASGVDEVCSVSTCVSEAPEGWINKWRHNKMWVYDTPEMALSVVPESKLNEFDLYAYRIFPVVYNNGEQKSFEIPLVSATPLSDSFERLGFDIVSRTCGNEFECSPLSCNHMAESVTVNCWCLVDDVETAFNLAAEFEAGGCEPGPYYIVEVWREKRAALTFWTNKK